MKKSIIVAQATNRAIGKKGKLPWHLPADLAHFKNTTYGHPIIIGRNTFEAIGYPLPGRTNIILTRSATYTAPVNCKIAHDLAHAFAYATQAGTKETFIIGGEQVYRQALQVADTIYLTEIHAHFAGDTFFPCIDLNQWEETYRIDYPADSKNAYAYSFVTYLRKHA